MKKIIVTAAALAAVSALSVTAFADETVYVTLADGKGELQLTANAIDVADEDGDGAITVNDTLIAAHRSVPADVSGYETADGDYGPYITKLLGEENGGSYGYYVNNTMSGGLTDPVKTGDTVNAYVYSDLEAWSDTYCYFDKLNYEISESDPTVTVTLYAMRFDENWSPMTVPVEGATIYVDGKATDYVTDANGSATITVDYANMPISAKSDSEILVPPAAWISATAVSASEAEEAAPAEASAETPAAGDVAAASDSTKGSPDTGIADTAAVAGIAVLAAGAFAVSKFRK